MQFSSRPSACSDPVNSSGNSDFLRRLARRLLRDLHSTYTSKALPVLRRLLAARGFPAQRLSELYKVRDDVQLKHVLHMLACELGYADWAKCKNDIDRQEPAFLDRYRIDMGAFGDYQQVWFSSVDEAQRWQREHGGHVVAYGSQAVLIDC